MPAELIVAPPEELARRFVDDVTRELRATPPGRRFALAIPGGSVAQAFLPVLARATIDWRAVHVFWCDERAVAPTAADSNFGLASRLWLGPAGVPAERVHRMRAEAADRRAAVEEYARTLGAVAGSPPRLDYLLLGVGEDGHVASVYPHHHDEAWADDGVAWVDDAPKPPARRMTLTPDTLARASRVAIAAFGASKAGAVAAALDGPRAPSPLARLLRAAARPLLLLDPEAARRLDA